jgi:predicted TIM-barrel fold metal-dependent hydrolase
MAEIEPYLDEAWRQFVDIGHVRLGPLFEESYPPMAVKSGERVSTTYDELRASFLDGNSCERAILTCTTLFDAPRNPHYQAAMASALNDWLRTEWLDRDPRLRAGIVVPYANADAAAEEIERVAEDHRFVQVVLPIRADAPWGQRAFAGIHRAASANGLVLALHAWGVGGRAPTQTGRTASYTEDYVLNSIVVQQHVVSLVAEGVLSQFPELKVAVLECGFTWLPTLLWRMDKHWKTFWAEVPWVRDLPSEYVRRQLAATVTPAGLGDATSAQIRDCVDMVGLESLLYASDHPHEHGAATDRLLDALDGDGRAAVLGGNASRFYARR